MEPNLEMKPEHAAFLFEIARYLEQFTDEDMITSHELSNFALVRGFIFGMVTHAGFSADKLNNLPESPIKFK